MMKKLIYIFILTLFIGCSAPTGTEPGFTPYTIGTWEFVAPDSAVWVGEQYQAKSAQGDTITITSPQGHQISMWKGNIQNNFNLLYIDSSVTNETADQFNIDGSATEFIAPPAQGATVPITFNSQYRGINPYRFKMQINAVFNCDASFVSSDNIAVRLYRESGNPFRTYVIKANGFEESLRSFWCD